MRLVILLFTINTLGCSLITDGAYFGDAETGTGDFDSMVDGASMDGGVFDSSIDSRARDEGVLDGDVFTDASTDTETGEDGSIDSGESDAIVSIPDSEVPDAEVDSCDWDAPVGAPVHGNKCIIRAHLVSMYCPPSCPYPSCMGEYEQIGGLIECVRP